MADNSTKHTLPDLTEISGHHVLVVHRAYNQASQGQPAGDIDVITPINWNAVESKQKTKSHPTENNWVLEDCGLGSNFIHTLEFIFSDVAITPDNVAAIYQKTPSACFLMGNDNHDRNIAQLNEWLNEIDTGFTYKNHQGEELQRIPIPK